VTEKPLAIPPELIKLLDPAEQAAARKRRANADRQLEKLKRYAESGLVQSTVMVPKQQTKTIRACAAFLRKYPNAELDFTDPGADD
jgi:hypothetical protein